MTSVIRLIDLSKQYGRIAVLDDVNLEIPRGSIFGLLGPNGAGKTTTIKIALNLLRPTTGRAEVLGCDSRRLGPEQFTRIGYVSENQQMPGSMTVEEWMSYLKPFYPKWEDDLADGLLNQFELPRSRKLSRLSRGMWMKAALASSLAYRPELLILDEPFSGLDPGRGRAGRVQGSSAPGPLHRRSVWQCRDLSMVVAASAERPSGCEGL